MATATKRTTKPATSDNKLRPNTPQVETSLDVLAARLNEPAIIADFDKGLDAAEDNDQSPLMWAMDFREVYSREEILAMPVVGTHAVDKDGKATGITNPDIIKVDRVMEIGGTRKVEWSYFEGLGDKSAYGQSLQSEIDTAKKKAGESMGNKDQLKTEHVRLTKRQDRFHQRISKAFAYLQQCVRWEDIATDETTGKQKVMHHLTMIDLLDANKNPVKDDDGDVIQVPSKSPKPIKVWDGSLNGTGQVFVSVGTFNGLDIAAAIEKDGGSWNSLLNPESDGASDTQKVQAAKWSNLPTMIASINALFDTEGSDKTAAMELGKKDVGKILAYDLVRLWHHLGLLAPIAMPGHDQVEAERNADHAKEAEQHRLKLAEQFASGPKGTVTLKQQTA